MKTLFRTILLLLLITISFSTCKTDYASEHKRYYRLVNEDYANSSRYINGIYRKADKPKEKKAEFKTTDTVYHELDAAYLAQMDLINQKLSDIGNTLDVITATQESIVATIASQPVADIVPALPVDEQVVSKEDKQPLAPAGFNGLRVGKVTITDEADRDFLKKYNVMIASLRNKAGADWLKKVFEDSDERIVVVKGNDGMYKVFIGSYDNLREAVAKRNKITADYTQRYTKSQLQRKYAILFTDLWIFRNE